MDRPTCKTCPYWENYTDELDIDEDYPYMEGKCVRFPPQWVGFAEKGNQLPSISPGNYDQPSTLEDDTCGEHPDFPAYVASLKVKTINT